MSAVAYLAPTRLVITTATYSSQAAFGDSMSRDLTNNSCQLGKYNRSALRGAIILTEIECSKSFFGEAGLIMALHSRHEVDVRDVERDIPVTLLGHTSDDGVIGGHLAG